MKKDRVTTGFTAAILAVFSLTGCRSGSETAAPSSSETPTSPTTVEDQAWRESEEAEKLREIFYAGGCFWGVESYFAQIPGVYDVTVGYANGTTEHPTYEDVCRHTTGHAETVHVIYDPKLVSLQTLTEHFFLIINPLSLNQQGNLKLNSPF